MTARRCRGPDDPDAKFPLPLLNLSEHPRFHLADCSIQRNRRYSASRPPPPPPPLAALPREVQFPASNGANSIGRANARSIFIISHRYVVLGENEKVINFKTSGYLMHIKTVIRWFNLSVKMKCKYFEYMFYVTTHNKVWWGRTVFIYVKHTFLRQFVYVLNTRISVLRPTAVFCRYY